MKPISSIAVFVLLTCLSANCPADTAREILDATGITGGLVVHVGCGDGKLTADLHAGDGFLVHGLDADAKNVAAARKHVASLGLYGPVSVDGFNGQTLPYADDLANLLVCETPGRLAKREMMRVLRPGGVAYVKVDRRWTKTVKPWPTDIDEWTHFLHGPDNNAVGRDAVVGIPRQMKWIGLPKFARAHEQLASMSACVTTAGRLFYIIDETPRSDIRFPSKWSLVARDAFNGVVLWKRPIADWADQLRRFRAGPAGTCFRLAAKDDRVYVTLGHEAPVSILDAVTGRTLATCKDTENARQVLLIDGRLVVLVDTRPRAAEAADAEVRRGNKPAPGMRAIVAADAASGETLWRTEIKQFVHPAVAADDGRVFYQTKDKLCGIDLESGKQLWTTEAQMSLTGHEAGWESPTLVVSGPVVYCADFKRIIAVDVKTGKQLWQDKAVVGYNAPPDVFATGGLIWMQEGPRGGMVGLDPITGQQKKRVPSTYGYMHHRCYRNKATERFMLRGDQGVQFVDFDSGDVALHHWIRGTCQYGIMPANGLLYITPDSCACNMKSKLAGFWAIGPESSTSSADGSTDDVRLEKGPAYGKITQPVATSENRSDSWPMHRHDAARSGLTKSSVPVELAVKWQLELGGRLTAATIAEGLLFVASIDTHTVHALDATTGQEKWAFTAGGRIDSPPTIHDGMALFGSADGWVYALRATDGELIWRFRAAPHARMTFVNGQLESVWPVHGSVLVHGDRLAVAAGRTSYLDGGIRLYTLNPATGKMLSETTMYSPDPETGKQPTGDETRDVRGALSDILLADGDDVYMRHIRLDFATGGHTRKGLHMLSPIGLLDDTWWHRAYWLMSDRFIAHWSGWWKAGNVAPSGKILSYDENTIFGYGRDKYPGGNTGQWRGGEKYQLFACAMPDRNAPPKPPTKRQKGKKPPKPQGPKNPWTAKLPFYVRAMVVADGTIFAAGPPEMTATRGSAENALILERPEEAEAAWRGEKGGILWAVSTDDGGKLAEYQLKSMPIFDGMSATAGHLYLSTADGKVICFGGK